VGVLYGITSNMSARAQVELPSDNRENVLPETDVLAFDQVSRVLAATAQPYDVLLFPDGELRPDTLEPQDLAAYRTLVVPACERLTPPQADLLEGFADTGGRLVVLGDLGSNLGRRMEALMRRDGTVLAEPFRFSLDMLPFGPQVHVVDGVADLVVSLHRVEGGTALHLIRYDYDEAADRVPKLDRLVLDVRLPFEPGAVEAVSPHGDLVAASEPGPGGTLRLVLRWVRLYGIVRIAAA
jgi:hypothetical protein